MVNCPRCGTELEEEEEEFENMTEGQQADYDAGFNRPHYCPRCGHRDLYDVEVYDYDDFDDPEIDDLVEITRVDANSFEEVIEHALRSKCFIEAISLTHNVIEAFLKRKIEDATANDSERLDLLKKKFSPKYLRDYTTISYLLGIIDKSIYKLILDFNDKRNKVIHELLTNPKDIRQIKAIARAGREIQMKLSPLNHSEEDIKNIMAEFDRITS